MTETRGGHHGWRNDYASRAKARSAAIARPAARGLTTRCNSLAARCDRMRSLHRRPHHRARPSTGPQDL